MTTSDEAKTGAATAAGAGPLEGCRILDLSRLLPGGFATALLGDLGAEVIKIEQPGVGDHMRWLEPRAGGTSAHSWITDRNKRSVAINLKDPRGLDAFRALVGTAQVLVETFRPGVMAALGAGYDDLRSVNPSLVYCSISGYGQDGPLRATAGHDINYAGRAGLLSITGTSERPVLPGVQIADLGGGSLMALVGLLAALVRARATGEGDHVDISMTDGAFSWLSVHLGVYLAGGELPGRETMRLNGRYPAYNVYQCSDGRWITVGALEPPFWRVLCETVERPDLVSSQFDPDAVIAWRELFARRSRAEWLELLTGVDACVGPVNDLTEAIADPQLSYRQMVTTQSADDGEHPQLGTPIKLRAHPASLRTPAPALGADSRAYLAAAGISDTKIDELIATGIIGEPDKNSTGGVQ